MGVGSGFSRWSKVRRYAAMVPIMVLANVLAVAPVTLAQASPRLAPNSTGELDCNGFSPVQHSIKASIACTDIRGFANITNANNEDGRFYDNGHYIGHDEPDMTFLSARPGSGNDVTWNETLPQDPAALPTVAKPGQDVSHWFELSVAPWFSMALCNPDSYPLLPCTPQNDANAPACSGTACSPNSYPGAGSSFLEMQFYPPGDAPFAESVSCDNKHWCASLHINDVECTFGFRQCNNHCIEPTNFAFVQTDGVPTGPPSPQKANLATFTPNKNTLLMNPNDKLSIRIHNAPAPGGNALRVSIADLTTHQNGFMQASAANGFASTSIVDCSGVPFNYQPEYSTAKAANIIPWAALQTNISTQFEIGHFEPCTKVTNFLFNGPGGPNDPTYNKCVGPYEAASDKGGPEIGEAPCFTKGDTHGSLHSDPNQVAGCLEFIFQNGDLDFDGSGYWKEWPTGPAPTAMYPGSFVQSHPTSGGSQYAQFFFQTDVALSEATCGSNPAGCAVPPPNAPGKFYPYFSQVNMDGACKIEFGNVSQGVRTFGRDAQYGTDQIARLGYHEFEGQKFSNTCPDATQ